MSEHLVDVLNDKNTVLHVFPVTIDDQNTVAKDVVIEQKAIEAAAAAQIVPQTDLGKLRARPHVGRGGPLAPFGDNVQIKFEQQQRREQRIRERAYFLWLAAGGLADHADDFWFQACALEDAK